MSEHEAVSLTQAEVNKIILADKQCNQFWASLDNQAFLLSRTQVEGDVVGLWIQDLKAIKVDDFGPTEEHNRLVYRQDKETGRVRTKLVERYGFPDVKQGEAVEFLERLLSQGLLRKVEK